MKNKDWRDIFDEIKKWYEEVSGASKFVIILTVLLLISNVIINIWSGKRYQEVEQIIDEIKINDTYEMSQYLWFTGILNKMYEFIKYLFFIFISICAYYISLYVGKLLGLLKSITEFLSDIKNDSYLLVALGIYDIMGLALDLYTIYSMVTF